MSLLKEWFGPSQDDIWKQLATEISADFVDGGLWKGNMVQASVKEWTVTLDSYTVLVGKVPVTSTRMRAPYVNKDGFTFNLYQAGFFSKIGKRLGMQDVTVGHPDFDKQFVIQGNDEAKLRLLFANPAIRRLIQAQPDISLKITDDDGWGSARFPTGVDQLTFEVVDSITDIERLKQLYELFAEVLNQLCRIGSAYEDDPKVQST